MSARRFLPPDDERKTGVIPVLSRSCIGVAGFINATGCFPGKAEPAGA